MVSIFFIFIIGICIGSFLNVLIDRLPSNKSILGRSHCEFCKKELKWKDLIPVASFVYLKGRCRYCHTPLSYQYPAVEIITGVLFVSTYLILISGGIFNFQFSIFNEIINHKSLIISLVYYLIIVSAFIVVFFADLKYGIIPDKILIPTAVISLAYIAFSIFYPLSSNVQFSIFNHLLSAVAAFLFFLFIYLVTRGRGMGFGDVKLAFVIGLILGFPGIVLAIYIAFLTGGLVGIILILWKKKKLKSAVPFGPFLIIGAFTALFFQNQNCLPRP